MKKTKKTLLIATTFAAAVAMTACGTDNSSSQQDSSLTEVDSIALDDNSLITDDPISQPDAPNVFDPSSEDIQCVYGPPSEIGE